MQSSPYGCYVEIGDGKTIRFWEDVWCGNCCLATQFWELYIIADPKNIRLASVWDGENLKISFRRRVDHKLLRM